MLIWWLKGFVRSCGVQGLWGRDQDVPDFLLEGTLRLPSAMPHPWQRLENMSGRGYETVSDDFVEWHFQQHQIMYLSSAGPCKCGTDFTDDPRISSQGFVGSVSFDWMYGIPCIRLHDINECIMCIQLEHQLMENTKASVPGSISRFYNH